jgi:hypothetical protein
MRHGISSLRANHGKIRLVPVDTFGDRRNNLADQGLTYFVFSAVVEQVARIIEAVLLLVHACVV